MRCCWQGGGRGCVTKGMLLLSIITFTLDLHTHAFQILTHRKLRRRKIAYESGCHLGTPLHKILDPPLYTVYMCVCPQSLCPTVCADPTLNIENLRLVMQSVEDWYGLGSATGGLYVPIPVCNNIRSSYVYKTDEEKKEALLLYYLRYVPNASWQHVVGALHHKEEAATLKVAKSFLKCTPGQFLSGHTCSCLCLTMHACMHVFSVDSIY